MFSIKFSRIKIFVESLISSQCKIYMKIFTLEILGCNIFCFFQRSDGFLHWSTFISNISCLIFYPLEHLAWLADLRLVPYSSERLWDYSLLCWVVYSAIQIIQLLYKLIVTYGKPKEQKLQKQKSNSMLLCLGLLKYTCDLLCGLHWMGSGPLSNKLSYSSLGLLGTISSIVQLYHALN